MASEIEKLRDENALLRERVRDLEGLLLKVEVPMSLHLSRKQGEMLSLLLACPSVTRVQAMAALYGSAVNDPPFDGIIPMFVHRLRRKLAVHGIAIQSRQGSGLGWWLTHEDKARVRALP